MFATERRFYMKERMDVIEKIKMLAITNRLNLKNYMFEGKVDLGKLLETLYEIDVISETHYTKFQTALAG